MFTQIKSALLFLALVSIAFAVETKQFWDDTVKVCIIWNEETGTDGTLPSWNIQHGEIGDSTRAFVEKALTSIPSQNIKVFKGSSPEWSSIAQDVNNLRPHFNNELPNVIAYINAGYEWDTLKYTAPDSLLVEASDSGIGIVAIGDDAAYDGKSIFPLKGPNGVGEPIQYHGYDENDNLIGPYSWPPMEDGIIWGGNNYDTPQYGYDDLLIWIDSKANDSLEQGGLLWNVNTDTLRFKDWGRTGRYQADADLWTINTSTLDNYALIGFQTGKAEGVKIPKETGDATERAFNVISTLQDDLNRIVMLGYQPQYLADETASLQIVYNSLYWASKAKELLKLPDPLANPSSGNPKNITSVALSLDESQAGKLPQSSDYDLWYTLDGSSVDSNATKYTGSFDISGFTGTVTLKVKALSTDVSTWQHSNEVTFTYEYVSGPLLDSAFFHPGAMIDLNSGTYAPDSLRVRFNKDVTTISDNQPFILYEGGVTTYRFTLTNPQINGRWVTFIISDRDGNNAYSVPTNNTDSINIDPSASVTGIDGTVQDDPNNRKTILLVKERDLPAIATPTPSPGSGNTQEVTSLTLSVDYPTDPSLYTIRYSFNGDVNGSSDIYNGSISLPTGISSDVTLKAVAFSNDRRVWRDSDTLTVTYEYVAPPKIATPQANPSSGNTQSVTSVSLSVDNPTDGSLYTIWYEINGGGSIEYNGSFDIPKGTGSDVVVTAWAISNDPQNWQNSDRMSVTYQYIAPPVIDSAIFSMGEMKDYATSEMAPDTLTIYFDQSVQNIDLSAPFISSDSAGNTYQFELSDIAVEDGSVQKFIVTNILNKEDGYLPVNLVDLITINVDARITSADNGVYQDGSNNVTVPLIVRKVKPSVVVNSMWYVSETAPEDLNAILSPFGSTEGALIIVDPRTKLTETEFEEYSISIVILDMLGNVILSYNSNSGGSEVVEGHVVTISDRAQYALIWNGKNENNRRVGTAAYVGMITVTTPDGQEIGEKSMISAKRRK